MKKRRTTSRRKTRLPPHERRSELVAAAAKLLTEGGLEALEFTAVAAEARVTRPVVYKFFPTRTALVEAILADFEDELTRRFFAAASGQMPSSLEDATRIFIDAICETIETKGAGAWELLGGTEYHLFRPIRQHRRRPPPARGAEAVPSGREPALTLAPGAQHRPAAE